MTGAVTGAVGSPGARLRIDAPAKLNLFLHVLGRRPDGYHELQTLFRLVDLHDTLQLEATGDGRIVREPPPPGSPLADVPEAQDLTVRAARLLQQATGVGLGARIAIDKRIPAGGGLGGGSTDAAAVLLALDRLWDTRLGVDALADLGLALGADVPVFVRGQSAWGEGRGERLTPVALPPAVYLIVHPGVAVSTASVFQAPELRRDSPPLDPAVVLAGDPLAGTRNDCEPVVRARHPEVAAALDWLGARAPARLTGTGACLFAPFDDEDAARRVAFELPVRWTGFVVHGR